MAETRNPLDRINQASTRLQRRSRYPEHSRAVEDLIPADKQARFLSDLLVQYNNAAQQANRKPLTFRKLIDKHAKSLITVEDVNNVVDQLITAANRGEHWAISEFLDRFVGKPTQNLNMDINETRTNITDVRVRVTEALGLDTDSIKLPDQRRTLIENIETHGNQDSSTE